MRLVVVGALVALTPHAAAPLLQQSASGGARRITERLQSLQREADELAIREKTLLNELRQLELQRQIKNAELSATEAELQLAERHLAEATTRAASLDRSVEVARPDVERRLVRLYKMGRPGYWRMLLNVEDVRSIGRVYRMAAALTRLDSERVTGHNATLDALQGERKARELRASEVKALRDRAVAARSALDRAVASHAALVSSIEKRRDLAGQLMMELRAAQQVLQSAGNAAGAGSSRVPIRPFQGDLPWPATGIVIGRFGQLGGGIGGLQITRTGLEISLAEGRPVSAVHDGIVNVAGTVSGYGTVVIIDHGERVFSAYGYLASRTVNKGDRVETGGRLGLSGRNNAGNPSLYFELRIDGKPVDPLQWLRKQP